MNINYRALAAYAGEWLLCSRPDPIHIGEGEEIPDFATAVYVALGLQSEVLYVGSVRRVNPRAVKARVSEHLAKRDRFENWNLLYVVPLRPETPLTAVRTIEGRIGQHLGPTSSRALPRLK